MKDFANIRAKLVALLRAGGFEVSTESDIADPFHAQVIATHREGLQVVIDLREVEPG